MNGYGDELLKTWERRKISRTLANIFLATMLSGHDVVLFYQKLVVIGHFCTQYVTTSVDKWSSHTTGDPLEIPIRLSPFWNTQWWMKLLMAASGALY